MFESCDLWVHLKYTVPLWSEFANGMESIEPN